MTAATRLLKTTHSWAPLIRSVNRRLSMTSRIQENFSWARARRQPVGSSKTVSERTLWAEMSSSKRATRPKSCLCLRLMANESDIVVGRLDMNPACSSRRIEIRFERILFNKTEVNTLIKTERKGIVWEIAQAPWFLWTDIIVPSFHSRGIFSEIQISSKRVLRWMFHCSS